MNLELVNKLEKLMTERGKGESNSLTYARLWGMASAMLTTEQLETMVGYLEKWNAEEIKL